jgi:hypothetical protein
MAEIADRLFMEAYYLYFSRLHGHQVRAAPASGIGLLHEGFLIL